MPVPHQNSSCFSRVSRFSWPLLALAGAACLAALPPASATTLVRCKIAGKTVYSDTDCPRSSSLKNDLPTSKPIRISRKTKAKSIKRG